jgi:hypothetical protein
MLLKYLLATVYSVFLFQGKLTPADGRCGCSWECANRICYGGEYYRPQNYRLTACNDVESQKECEDANTEVADWVGPVVAVLPST